MSTGKVFEEDFETSAKKFNEVDIERLKDPVGGQAGVRNICDFIAYYYPNIFYLELKSRQGNTLNFKELPNTQYVGLQKKSGKRGVVPGFLVNFSDHSEVYFIHINDLVRLRQDTTKKSLHINDARELGVKLPGRVKRTRFAYDVGKFLKELGNVYG